MKILLYLLCITPIIVVAQEKESHFEKEASWSQIREKARIENKYIFVDCFATWCEPCKEMDDRVYTRQKVANEIDKDFIAIKVQMDTAKVDDESVKAWYKEAHLMMVKYNIKAYPSFLFFDPHGRIVHKEFGFKNPDEFLALLKDARTPDRQYYVLLDKYRQGHKDYSTMGYLAERAMSFQEAALADTIAHDYMKNYLMKLRDSELFQEENIRFVANFMDSKDQGFKIFYDRGHKVDSVMGKGAAEGTVEYIISKEDIYPRLWRNSKPVCDSPDWNGMTAIIARKYNIKYVEHAVIDAQIRWYSYIKDWPKLAKYNLEKLDRYGMDSSAMGKILLNDMIWGVIFLHSDDSIMLGKGIYWMEAILRSTSPNSPADMDTYANLLYKVGRKDEAYAWEERAIKMEEENAVRNNMVPDKTFKEALDKMKKGFPTWVSN